MPFVFIEEGKRCPHAIEFFKLEIYILPLEPMLRRGRQFFCKGAVLEDFTYLGQLINVLVVKSYL